MEPDAVPDARRRDVPSRIKVSQSGDAHAVSGGYANTGVHIGDVNLRTGSPVRTRYRYQVERIAPAQLVGREAELAELTEFCTDEASAGSYQWWRARAWAGKSALMSWFVLHPPAGVRVVSYFVTARLAGQADRVAFVDNVLEQLLTLLGVEVPPLLTPATREAHLLGALEEAARLVSERGESLVLVVDGLDEDRGVTTAPDAHSVAALLPATPPAGLRVLVAGRPDPPIPGDVPDHHPLRDEAVVRVLEVSSQAQVSRKEMERDLKRLLIGTTVERDLLGLLVASGGGLSAADLSELTGVGAWEVKDNLETVAGRSFTRRGSPLNPSAGPEVYLLGHEELQFTAIEMLGSAALAGYRKRIHTWADQYRNDGWPEGTPEYLLSGYHTILLDANNLSQATALCMDPVRQSRLLALTGGDSIASAQIATTLDAQISHTPLDLIAVGRLAVHRDHLTSRNFYIPIAAPALMARLGHIHEATALANSMTEKYRACNALLALAEVLGEAGSHDQADQLIGQAAEIARSMTDNPPGQGSALTSIAQAWAKAGHADRAIETARSIALMFPYMRCDALARVSEVLLEEGHRERANELLDEAASLAPSSRYIFQQVAISVSMARALAKSGQRKRARELLQDIAMAARSDADPETHKWFLPEIIGTLAKIGYLDEAVLAAGAITTPGERCEVLVSVAEVLLEARDHDRGKGFVDQAAELVDLISVSDQKFRVLTSVASLLVEVNDRDQARRLIGRAEEIARSHTKSESLVSVAKVLAKVGDDDRAEELLRQAIGIERTTTYASSDVKVLVSVAAALAENGDRDQARKLIDNARHISDSTASIKMSREVLISTASVLAHIGDYDGARSMIDQALNIIYSTTEPTSKSEALLEAVSVLMKIGDRDRAAELIDQITEILDSITDAIPPSHVMMSMAKTFANEGFYDSAIKFACAIPMFHLRCQTLVLVAGVLFGVGDSHRARTLIRQALETIPTIRELHWQVGAIVSAAGVLFEVGDDKAGALIRQALEIIPSIGHPATRVNLLILVAGALAEAGDHSRGDELIEQAMEIAPSISDVNNRVWALELVVKALIKYGDHDRAIALAESITEPAERSPALLLYLARAQACDNNQAQAEVLAARALQVGRWESAAAPLCRVSVPAALAIIHESMTLTRLASSSA